MNERTLRHTGSELAALVDLGSALERAHRPGEVVGVVVAHLRTRLRFARVVVVARQDGSWVTWGDGAQPGEGTEPLGRVADAVLADGQARLVRALDDGLLAAQLPDAHNVVVAALTGDDEPFGLVVAEWGRGINARIPGLTVSSLLQSVAHAALALRNAHLLDEVERLATRDELTGLANRRLFEEALPLEVGRHDRSGSPLSLVLLDVDHFKRRGPRREHQGLRRRRPLRRRRVHRRPPGMCRGRRPPGRGTAPGRRQPCRARVHAGHDQRRRGHNARRRHRRRRPARRGRRGPLRRQARGPRPGRDRPRRVAAAALGPATGPSARPRPDGRGVPDAGRPSGAARG